LSQSPKCQHIAIESSELTSNHVETNSPLALPYQGTCMARQHGRLPAFLSTTGGPWTQESDATNFRDEGSVELSWTGASAVRSLKKKLRIGAGCPSSATVGGDDSDAVLNLSDIQDDLCKLQLRSFTLYGSDQLHEALFVHDCSESRLLINKEPAFKPWHWLQDGDLLGLHVGGTGENKVLNFYRVTYLR